MKITSEHFTYMRQAIAAISPEQREAIRESISHDPRVKDTDMRFRWDLFYAAKLSRWACDNLYSYCNDTHIDSALKQIVRITA